MTTAPTAVRLIPYLPAVQQQAPSLAVQQQRKGSATAPQISEADLLQAAILQGDKAAFTTLVRQESPRLYSMIFRIVRDEDEARSILQETYLQCLERLSTFRGEAKLTTWVYSIGLNLARGARRKASRIRVMDHREFEGMAPAFPRLKPWRQPGEWDVEYRFDAAARKRLVHEAIERLPEQHRLIVQLKDIDGWATADVSRMLDISHVAVRVRLHRARQALRTLLAPYFSGILLS